MKPKPIAAMCYAQRRATKALLTSFTSDVLKGETISSQLITKPMDPLDLQICFLYLAA